MSSEHPRGAESAGVSRLLAVVLATVGFFALAIFGLGLLSLLTSTDIIATPGLGQAPGIVGMLAAVIAFALFLWAALGRARPSFFAVVAVGVAAALAHLCAIWAGVLTETTDLIIATAVAGDLVRGGASIVLLAAALIGAWGGIALRRTRARRPRWSWERDVNEE